MTATILPLPVATSLSDVLAGDLIAPIYKMGAKTYAKRRGSVGGRGAGTPLALTIHCCTSDMGATTVGSTYSWSVRRMITRFPTKLDTMYPVL